MASFTEMVNRRHDVLYLGNGKDRPTSAAIDEEAILIKIRRDIAESEKLMAERDKF